MERPSGYISMQMRICISQEIRKEVESYSRKYEYMGYTIKHSSFHQKWEVVQKSHHGEAGTVAVRPFSSKAQAESWVRNQVKHNQ